MILHSFDYPPMDGGIARLCGEIAAGLRRRGREVEVVTQAGESGAGSRVPELAETRVTAQRPWREWQALRRLRGSVGGDSPVICGTWYPEGLLAMLAGVRPIVILAHGNELLPVASRWRRATWRDWRESSSARPTWSWPTASTPADWSAPRRPTAGWHRSRWPPIIAASRPAIAKRLGATGAGRRLSGDPHRLAITGVQGS